MAKRTCSVTGCSRPHTARGYCNRHWRRWRETGDPGTASIRPRRPAPRICVIDGCEVAPRAHGMCGTHWSRWYRTGNPGAAELQRGGPETGYLGAHFRVYTQRGRASDYSCRHCGRQASEWAYDHTDPNVRYDARLKRLYSLDSSRYIPLCKTCHQNFDREFAPTAALLPGEFRKVRTWAKCNGWTVSDRGSIPGEVIVAYLKAVRRPWA